MDLDRIKDILKDEPAYRAKQAWRAVFADLIEDWRTATNLPAALRACLASESPLTIKATVRRARDGRTEKAALDFGGDLVETVLMRHSNGRNTVCVSSQVGCALACEFCLTGQGGFCRQLSAAEIVAQALFFARRLKPLDERVSNVVFMGMGEPFLNYDAMLAAIRTLNDPEGLGIAARRISVSTVGVVPGIRKFAREALQLNLAVSLHAPDDRLRSRLLPINKEYPIKELLAAVRSYQKATNRQVMIEYLLLQGVNDSPAQASALAELLQTSLLPIFTVNLIDYNSTDRFRPSPRPVRELFKQALTARRIKVVERFRFGREIKAACGQLAGRK